MKHIPFQIDQDFCNYLEYQLNDVFQHLDNTETKGFWCDGILLSEPDDHYSKDFVSKYRQVKLKAFVGKTGQMEYTLTLKLGRKALSRCARNLDITICIPGIDSLEKFSVDTRLNRIEVQLE